ncbi:hypothetical protein EYF80_066178 [Liparis tanakae]|uniref:Uncharacterized protein n=1 Tax=Liparis tanakae TaxID=230148 RepID=A0A4Z2E534_9TELE|nr:hypothetical protein EYF80_066178 [Liparis tanakae]
MSCSNVSSRDQSRSHGSPVDSTPLRLDDAGRLCAEVSVRRLEAAETMRPEETSEETEVEKHEFILLKLF